MHSNSGLPLKAASLDAFDFLVVAFLNIGKFYGKRDGLTGGRKPEFFTRTPEFVRAHHSATSPWEQVLLAGCDDELKLCAGELIFEHIARALGIPRPQRPKAGLGTSAGAV